MSEIVSLVCPFCGAPLKIKEGEKITDCVHCGTHSYIAEKEEFPKLIVRNRLDAEKAKNVCRGWWGGIDKARDIARVAVVGDVRLVYLPFWSVKGNIFAWFTGYNKHKNNKQPREEVKMEGFKWNNLACNTGDLGVESLPSLQGETEPFDESKIEPYATQYAITESFADAVSSAKSSMMRTIRRGISMYSIYQEESYFIEKEKAVIFYPIWIVDYCYKGRMYKVLMDGYIGRVIFGRAPGSSLFRSIAFTVCVTVGSFLIPLGIKLLFGCKGKNCAGLLMFPLVGLIIAAVGQVLFKSLSTVQGGKAIGASGVERVEI